VNKGGIMMRIDLLDNVSGVNNVPAVNAVRKVSQNDNSVRAIQNNKPETINDSSKTTDNKQVSIQNLEAYAKEKENSPSAFNDPLVRMAKKIGIIECETCAARQYQDGSNDVGVSFKNGGHISPQNAFAVVNSHEQEHVQEAKERASFDESTEFIGSSVRIFVSTCPECGRVYVSGGETRTVEGHSSHSQEINMNNPAVAFYNQENDYNKSEGLFFDETA